ncbi:hypothetical protein LPY96_19370 [Xanthomonas citri pv. malvacearum]|uniref:Uncharacterized protein n=1 Tax=Xanthomonas cassavae CFBP 4642 TaxID=1219375 RepID=A0ABS8HH10_9XANT|nr:MULTISPECIES: hypothetical protein [Xanthomonas]MCC4621449.1 hypothetical protein [Xanthomonas cassavae CFBP 4642]WAW86381.1 hypothetical protein LPY96_19370 [Xanthomonas citri pv. malvacearum]SOO02942.1 hypothetical protein XFF6960_730013 [Xanthomonas citri pv. fuscans]
MNVKPAELPAIVAELMAKYDTARSRAIQAQGSQFNEAAFHAWFTQQVQDRKRWRLLPATWRPH